MRQMRRMCLCFRPKSTHLFHGWNHDCNPSSSSTFSPLRLRSLHRVRHREEQGRIGKDQQRLWMMPSRNGGWVTLGHSLEGPFSLLLLPALPLLLSLILYLLLRYAHLPYTNQLDAFARPVMSPRTWLFWNNCNCKFFSERTREFDCAL